MTDEHSGNMKSSLNSIKGRFVVEIRREGSQDRFRHMSSASPLGVFPSKSTFFCLFVRALSLLSYLSHSALEFTGDRQVTLGVM
jgi:hypothetical protein